MNMAKLSVAIAILKNKPAAQSASDYTKSLASSNLEQMLQWEDKCQELEKLQQDTQLQCVAIASCSVNQSNTYTDSSVFLTPPCSGQPTENYTAFHTNFLQCTYHLKSSLALLQEPKLMDKADHLPILKTIENSLHFLLADPTRINIPSVKHSVNNIIEISKNVPLNSNFSLQLVNTMHQFFQSFMKDILLNDSIEPVQKYDHIHLVCQFVHSPTLQKTLFDTLLKFTSQFSTYLQELCIGLQQTLDPIYFENNYYVMSCLAECFMKAAQQPADLKTFLSLKLGDKIRTTLENCLSQVVDTYPIFAHSVWYLLALLDSIKSDHSQKPS